MTLHNDLRVVAEQVPASRSVSLGIWVKSGSRYEDQSNNGISHLLEHMLFKGTERFSAKDIANIFDSIGGNVNAFTSKEYTCYYAKVLDTQFPLATEVLADMYLNAAFDPAELEKEKNVINEEIAMYEDTPDDYVHDLIAQAVFDDHPLGYSILGNGANLARITAEELRTYRERHYHMNNTVISIAGNIDERSIACVEEHFSQLHRAKEPASAIIKPEYTGSFLFREKQTEQDHICIALPGLHYADDRMHAMILLDNMIGGGMSSRLFQEIREKQGLAYSVYSYHSGHMDSGLFNVYIGTHPKYTSEVLKLTMEVLEDIVTHGVTDAELSRSKEQLKGNLILSLESTSSRMNRNGKNELILEQHISLDALIEWIDSVTMDQVRALTKELFAQPLSAALVGASDHAFRGFNSNYFTV